jgi:hypothetical protein
MCHGARIERRMRTRRYSGGQNVKRKRPKPIAPADPFVPCGNCVEGWTTVQVMWGSMQVPSEKRCQCWKAHQEKLARAREQSHDT